MPSNEFHLSVPEDQDGQRLDRFLAVALPQYSREYVKSLILEQSVCVNGNDKSKPSSSLAFGDVIKVYVPEPVALDLEPQGIALDIVFEDETLLVVNKPSGMLTHPTGREKTNTLVNALLGHCKGGLSGINGVERPGIVHRLDRDTSGLLMVAKTDEAHRGLQQQLQARTVKRNYRTIVQGVLDTETGTIEASIGRNPKTRDKMCVIEGGRHAVTHWEVQATLGHKFSCLHIALETGRTHQIRVHMAHIGHPIVADPLYGTGLENVIQAPWQGQLLQAFRLRFQHPVSQEAMMFEIPEDDKYCQGKTWLEQWLQ